MSALELQKVGHSYGDLVAVQEVSLAVEAGEIVCLLGPSGCGKTTVLRLAAGLESLQRGRILMDGLPVADEHRDLPPEKRHVGLVFQDYALFPHLSVLDNVIFGLRRELGAEERRRRGLRALERVGMERSAASYPHMLSGGQQQRVALARALAVEPRVMLLDEPFSGLDSQLRHRVRDQTLHILKGCGAASVVVTHDPEEAMFMADRIALMKDGRVEQIGVPADLYYRPASAFVAGFFSEINRLESVARDRRVSTPLGELPAEGLADGTPVEILIRPEALRLNLPGSMAARNAAESSGTAVPLARVMAARLLGRTSLVHLSLAGGPAGELHLHARVPGSFQPPETATMAIELDRSQAFVFPLESDA